MYLYAQVYYLIRCGHPEEALNLLSDHQSSLRRDDWTLPGAFKTLLSSSERKLPKAQKDQLYNDFNSNIRNNSTVDQFKYALYKLIGRFELGRKTMKVATTTEDWMWLQLSLIREARDDSPQEMYSLEDIGNLVNRYGSEKFDQGGQRPFAWFNLLLFTAQFERVSEAKAVSDIAYAHRLSHTCTRNLPFVPMPFTSPLHWHTMVFFARPLRPMPSSVSYSCYTLG